MTNGIGKRTGSRSSCVASCPKHHGDSSCFINVAVRSLEMFEVMNSQDLSLVTYISYCRMLRIQMSAAILDRPSNSIVL